MKKILMIIVILTLTAGCSSLNSGGSGGRGASDIRIALDRVIGSNSRSAGLSVGGTGALLHGKRTDTTEKAVIYRAQKQLQQLGYDPGPIDGLLGPRTRQAVKRYQKDNRLPETGNLNHATIRKLMPADRSSPKGTGSAAVQPQTYSLMGAQEARRLVERHIRESDIRLETSVLFRNPSARTGSESSADIFQGIRFDRKNYAVFALCETNYKIVTPTENLPGKLAELDISLPDDYMSFTFNGVFFTTVDLEVESNPVFSYRDREGFMIDDRIPAGGYRWMIGESGMKLGSTFILFQAPSKKNIIRSWSSDTDEFAVKMSLPKERGILLDLYRP